MRIAESQGTLKRYRRSTPAFQQTFQTPLKDLDHFVDVIMSCLPRVEAALAVFERVVFEPRYNLVPLYEKYSLTKNWNEEEPGIEAQSASEVRELLQAVLSEWIDFLFAPTPGAFVIFADHDEYITFFAHR